jgi:hypothetical protein
MGVGVKRMKRVRFTDRLPDFARLAGAAMLLGWCAACSAASVEQQPAEAPQAFTTEVAGQPEPLAPPAPLTAGPGEEEQEPPYQEPLPTGEVEIPTTPPASPALLESRRLTLEWPGRIRVGDTDVIKLSLEMDEEGSVTPTVEFAGHELRSEPVGIPDLYDTHTVLAEARVEIAGLSYTPQGVTSQTLFPGERLDFYWSVKPEAVGTYRGTVWLSLRFHPKSGGEASQRTLSAQVLEIQAVNLLGMGGTPARVIGTAGTAIGSLLGLDDVLSWLRRRRASRRRS